MSCDWILLRGWSREAGHWGRFPDLLQRAFPEGRIFPIDLPGSGERRGECCPCNPDRLTRSVRSEAHRVLASRVNDKPKIFATSLGGMLAWSWACQFPEDLSGVAIANSSFLGISSWRERLRWRALPAVARALFERDPAASERGVLSLVSNIEARRQEVLSDWISLRRERGVTRANALRQLLAASRMRAPFPPPPGLPVLVLASEADRLVNPRCSIDLSTRQKLPLKLHPTAGHDLTLDDPEWVVARLADHFG